MLRGRLRARVRGRPVRRSFATKFALLIAIFFTVPLILYGQFRTAEQEKNVLLLDSLQTQGRLIARNLRPYLEAFDGSTVRPLTGALSLIAAEEDLKIRLLLQPANPSDVEGFFYVDAAPPVPNNFLDRERDELMTAGVLNRLATHCRLNQPLAVRYVNPAGEEEVVTSVTPVTTPAGCWAIITSYSASELLGASLGQPYWQTDQIKIAAAIYVVMALLVISIFYGVWRSLRHFGRLAREIRTTGARESSFAKLNDVPELGDVAQEFDHMVDALQGSSLTIKRAAEENAHAFKTPIAIIAQSIEPLKRLVSDKESRAARSLELIERALGRLDVLVSAARRMDETTAELINPPRERVDVSVLIRRMLDGYSGAFVAKDLRLYQEITPDLAVRAGAELLEAVGENILDNAISFSPRGGNVWVRLAARDQLVDLVVEDEGPGVDPRRLEDIFERYVSNRLTETDEPGAGGQHFGIGLWLVRRNVEAVGGTVRAENRTTGGLRIVVTLPRLIDQRGRA